MKKPSTPEDEETRLNGLKSLGILDTPRSERFDCITRMASRLFQAPIAIVSLIDENRQWFKSCIGLDTQETHRDISFCGHAILQDSVFVIPDTFKDNRFFDNPLVHSDPFIRFYAGCPLTMSNGSKIGTLCIIDHKPRIFEASDITLLEDLASIVQREFVSIQAENSATQFKSTMNAAFDAIIVMDKNHRVVNFNAAAEATFGYKHQDIVGLDLLDLIIPTRHRAAFKQSFEPYINTSQGPLIGQRTEIEARHQDGHEFPIEVAITKEKFLVGDSSSVTFVGFIRDISERKLAAAQIIQASKLATLGEMATSVAHELNQPLSAIRMAAANSRRKISKGTFDFQYLSNKLTRIEDQATRAASIIDHMRMFGREAKETPEPVDPRNVVKNSLDLMGSQLRLAGIEVVTNFPTYCSYVLGHIIQMEQVILNLLTNAKDAMLEQDGNSTITLNVFEDDVGVHFTIEDTGGGIPDAISQRIFEPFFTTKKIGQGTGLGLSVSYGIVHDMHGTIVAENIAEGTRFTITLPSFVPQHQLNIK
jgi:PAS domain S-box-containing protein